MDTLSRKARHNARVRARLVAVATTLLHENGARATTIDAICNGAGMTRGAFYTHFPSKAAILSVAARADTVFLRALKARSQSTPDALWLGLGYLLKAVLQTQAGAGGARPVQICDVELLAEPHAADGAATLQDAILREMARGTRLAADHPVFLQVLTLAIGAQQTARCQAAPDSRNRVIDCAWLAIRDLLDASDPTAHTATETAQHP